MAIVMEANYSKKCGLPGYSSHQYMITLRTELADLAHVDAESARLHALLQSAVDREIQKIGFLPETSGNGNVLTRPANGNGNGNEAWGCSAKQRALILDLVEQHKLDKNAVEQLAQDRFGKTVKTLNKLEASELIDEVITMTGGTPRGPRRQFNGRATPANAR